MLLAFSYISAYFHKAFRFPLFIAQGNGRDLEFQFHACGRINPDFPGSGLIFPQHFIGQTGIRIASDRFHAVSTTLAALIAAEHLLGHKV